MSAPPKRATIPRAAASPTAWASTVSAVARFGILTRVPPNADTIACAAFRPATDAISPNVSEPFIWKAANPCDAARKQGLTLVHGTCGGRPDTCRPRRGYDSPRHPGTPTDVGMTLPLAA